MSDKISSDDLLAEFAQLVDRKTGWGTPTYERTPTSSYDACNLMEDVIRELDSNWSDIKLGLQRHVDHKRAACKKSLLNPNSS